MIAYDTETSIATDAEPVPDMACAQFAIDGIDPVVVHQSDPDLLGMVSEVLDETIVGANLPFDFGVTIRKWPHLAPKVWRALSDGRVVDVNTRQRLIDIAGGGLSKNAKLYSLAGVVKRWCGVELDKDGDARTGYGELIDAPLGAWPREALQYALDDAEYTLAAALKQDEYAADFERIHGEPLFANAAHQARAHWALHLGSLAGMHTDPARVAELKGLLERRLEASGERLQEVGLVRPSGSRNMKRLQEVLADAGAVEHTAGCKCESCQPYLEEHKPPRLKADAETLEGLDLSESHPLHAYRTYSRAQKMLGTYLSPFEKPVVRPRYTELMSNGRTAASGDLRQNLPQQRIISELLGIDWGFRECLVPAPGNVLIIADYSKVELVSWAQVLLELFGWDAPTSALARALNEGRDVHNELMLEMGSDNRTLAKRGNFGFMGGAGVDRVVAEALREGLRLARPAVEKMRDAWRRKWHGAWYFSWVEGNMHETGTMDFIHSSGRIATGLGFCDGCNYPFSGRSADATKDCLWRIAVEMYTVPESPLYGFRQPLYVHDENVLEGPADRADAAAARLEELMKVTYLEWCPDIPIGVDLQIAERYGK
jgi:hypothetical protein